MDRTATYFWAWLAVAAQVFFGFAPAQAGAIVYAQRAADCCTTPAIPDSCCVEVAPRGPQSPCCDCHCCAGLPTNQETPTPTAPPRTSVQQWAILPTAAASSFITTSSKRGPRFPLGPSLAPREHRGFLESRLRV
ncbi:MAG: hypothetical protein JNK58_10075 [Phycisphaerae bacterium]|nr:hypothetical protein [Phycisphaerae bacterium]